MYACVCVCLFARAHVCTCESVSVYMRACVYECAHVRVYVCLRARALKCVLSILLHALDRYLHVSFLMC